MNNSTIRFIKFIYPILLSLFIGFIVSYFWLWFIMPIIPGLHPITVMQGWGLSLFTVPFIVTYFIAIFTTLTDYDQLDNKEIQNRLLFLRGFSNIAVLSVMFFVGWIVHFFI